MALPNHAQLVATVNELADRVSLLEQATRDNTASITLASRPATANVSATVERHDTRVITPLLRSVYCPDCGSRIGHFQECPQHQPPEQAA